MTSVVSPQGFDADAIQDAADLNPKYIYFPRGTYAIQGHPDVHPHIVSVIEEGAEFHVEAGSSFSCGKIEGEGLKRLFYGMGSITVEAPANAEWWGAYGSGEDETNNLNRALREARTVLLQPNRRYKAQAIKMKAGNDLVMSGSTIEALDDNPGAIIEMVADCKVTGGTLIGKGGKRIGVSLRDASRAYLNRVDCSGCMDGFYLDGGEGIKIDHCIASKSTRNGVSLISCKSAIFEECEFYETKGDNPGAGICIEPDNSDRTVRNVEFRKCLSAENESYALIALTPGGEPITNVWFRACELKGRVDVRKMVEGSGVFFDQTKLS